MSSKRPTGGMASLMAKKAKTDAKTAVPKSEGTSSATRRNPFLSHPVHPEKTLQQFLQQVRTTALKYLPKESAGQPITKPFCEVEARLGILKVLHSIPERRVTSCGAKTINGHVVQAFDCKTSAAGGPSAAMESGVSRTHFVRWTSSGISEPSPLSKALGVTTSRGGDINTMLKHELVETELVETVYLGYSNDARVCFPGIHPPPTSGSAQQQPTSVPIGKMESKEKLAVLDFTIPAAPYDLRVTLSSEKAMDTNIRGEPPTGYKAKRVKRRRSYTTRGKNFAWQIDVTEVTTTHNSNEASSSSNASVDYEIECELREHAMLRLLNEKDEKKMVEMTKSLAQQLWWVITQINPLADALDVEEQLCDHPNRDAVQLALATCGALKRFVDSGSNPNTYESPISKGGGSASLANCNFVGCMPVNFSRHNLEDIQRGQDNAYYLSEKTDGVRYLMVFTGDTAVLVDRAMRGKQPIPIGGDSNGKSTGAEPMASILPLIKPGTVFDGEVVMNRRGTAGAKPRPVFIVFDVMAISSTEPTLHLPFQERLRHLRTATFRTPTANRDMFDPKAVSNPSIPLPLVRKNFVKRTELDDLLSHVVEEGGMRCYRNGELHNHLTDGIIFQPNRPYVCGTDRNLLKWKYLDTVTIDIEMLPLRARDSDDTLRVGCMGEEQTSVDMTRYVLLPKSERMKLEADKFEQGGQCKIAEVGFDPDTGEWYYLTLRPDKVAPNHISTVLGTLLELAESLTTDELRFRMSILPGSRDTYRKDMRGMFKQLMDHQRKKLKQQKSAPSSSQQQQRR